MKLPRTLALAALAVAILAPLAFAVPSTAPAVDDSISLPSLTTNLNTDFNTSDFDQRCFNTCTRVLCTNPQTCGPYDNSSGTRSCGCH